MADYPDAWSEFCRIGIMKKGGTAYQWCAKTEDITAMDWGEKAIETIPTVCGANIVKTIPMTKESMTLKMYPVSASLYTTSTVQGPVQWFHPQGTDDLTSPIAVSSTTTRNKHRIVLLWAETLPAAAETVPSSGAAYRIQIFNAYMTKYKPDFSDKILSAEVTFEWAPFDANGNANKYEESTDGTVLPAVTAYA